jgi:hypothetical protein
MPLMPAICDNCGAVFSSGVMGNDGALHTTFVNCTASPCPRCGGTGHIPDGIYNFIGNTIELLSGPQRTIDELKILAELLNKARRDKYSPQKLNEEIEKELPQFSSLLQKFLPKTKAEFYAFIGLILTAITIMINSENYFQVKKYRKQKFKKLHRW